MASSAPAKAKIPGLYQWSEPVVLKDPRGRHQSQVGRAEEEARHSAVITLYCHLMHVRLLPSTWLWHLVSYHLGLLASLYAELRKTMLGGGSLTAEPAQSNPGTHEASSEGMARDL